MSEVKRYMAIGGMLPGEGFGAGVYVRDEDFRAAQSELAALREERNRLDASLSCMSGHVLAYKLSRQRLLGRARARELHISDLQQRLADAERRNAECWAQGIERAAQWVDQRLGDFVRDHGFHDPDTGTLEFRGDGAEHAEELDFISISIRGLKPIELLKQPLSNAREELRAMIAAPVVERQPVYQLKNNALQTSWRNADKEAYDSVEFLPCYERRILYTSPPAPAADDMVRLLTRARIYARGEFRDEIDACLAGKTAPVTVVLPDRKPIEHGKWRPVGFHEGWNACIDKVKELNQ